MVSVKGDESSCQSDDIIRLIREFDAKIDDLVKSAKNFKINNKQFRFINIRTRPRLYYRHHNIYDSNLSFNRR